MNQTSAQPLRSQTARLADRPCPACGMPAAAMLAILPSGRRALIQACAICGRQEATPIDTKAVEQTLRDTPACPADETV